MQARSRGWVGVLALSIATSIGVAACDGSPSSAPDEAVETATPAAAAEPEPPAVDRAALLAEAEELFTARCQRCHGARGAANGPDSAELRPKPRNFQDPDWQRSVDDDHIVKVVLYGGEAVDMSPEMTGNPDLTSRPELVKALTRVIRRFGER